MENEVAGEDLEQGHADPEEQRSPTARCWGCTAAQTQARPPCPGPPGIFACVR